MKFKNIPKLYPSAKRDYVQGSGPIPCNLMIIGEAPGAEEDNKGVPFIGRSGKLLRTLVEEHLALAPSQYYITNAVKTRIN